VSSKGEERLSKKGNAMDTNMLILIVVLVLVFGGGGYYWRGRGR
jgi:hypothetical protein